MKAREVVAGDERSSTRLSQRAEDKTRKVNVKNGWGVTNLTVIKQAKPKWQRGGRGCKLLQGLKVFGPS